MPREKIHTKLFIMVTYKGKILIFFTLRVSVVFNFFGNKHESHTFKKPIYACTSSICYLFDTFLNYILYPQVFQGQCHLRSISHHNANSELATH